MANPVTTRGFKRYRAWLWEFVRVPLLESWTFVKTTGRADPQCQGSGVYIDVVPYIYILYHCIYKLYQIIFTYHSLLLYEYEHVCTVYSQTFSI